MRLALPERVRRFVAPVANLVRMARDPCGLLEDHQREHGDLFELRLVGQPPVLVCSDPEGVRRLMTSSYDDVSRFGGAVELFADRQSLILLDDDPHRARRKLLGPPFNGESVRAFGPTMLAICDRVLDRLPAERPLPLLTAMQDITMRVILRCIFGVDEGPRADELRELVVGYMDYSFGLDVLALGAVRGPAFAHATIDRLSARARARPADAPLRPSRLPLLRSADRLGRIRALLDAEIDRRTAEGVAGRDDALSRMLQARFDDGQPMSRDDLLAQLLLLVIGGYETTSQSLCWAVHCLMRHPEALTRLRAEIAERMPDGLDPTRVRDLHYLGAAIGESMRLYPVGIGVSRTLRKPMRIAGRDLEPGTVVMASIYLTQRHRALWPDADAFRPERMLERRPPAWMLFPFGAGVWRCLGAAFAEHEMRVVLARLLTRFHVRPDPTADVRPMHLGITMGASGGLPVILTPRE